VTLAPIAGLLARAWAWAWLGAAAPDAEAAGKVEFIWDAPSECPAPEVVTGKVEALLGGPVDAPRTRRVSAIARVRRGEDGRWEMRLYTVTPEETRERDLVDESCETLAEATAIVVATAIDPTVVVSGDAGGARLVAEEDGDADADADADADDHDHDHDHDRAADPGADAGNDPGLVPSVVEAVGARAIVRGSGGVAFGELSGAAGVASLAVGVMWPRVRVEIGATGMLGRRVELEVEARPRVDLHVWSLGAIGCGVPLTAPVELPVCAGLEAGEVLARPRGLDAARAGREPWVAATLGPRLAWVPHPAVALVLGVDLVVPLVRPAFDVEGYGRVARVGPAAGRAMLGIELRLPPRIAPRGGH
jgi:hypothetical protein